MAQNLCASPLDAGTTVHGHGNKVEFLNATMIEKELRESVFGACDAFIAAEKSSADPPLGLDTAASMAVIIFIVAVCVLFAAFFVFRRSNEDRDMIKALRGLDGRDLGIDNPLYDAPAMAKVNPIFTAPSNQGYLDVKPGYSSSESSEDETYATPSFDHRRSGSVKNSNGSKHGAKTMKRLAREEWVASMPADVNPMDALEMMFDVKQNREEASNYADVPASGSLAAGAGMSRKERRASQKAAKKAKKAGPGYYSGAFDSPLSNDGGYADIDLASHFDSDDSRNDEQGFGYDRNDTSLYDDFGKGGDDGGLYDDVSGPAFDKAADGAKMSTAGDESLSSSSLSDDEYGGFAQDAVGNKEDEGKIWMEWG